MFKAFIFSFVIFMGEVLASQMAIVDFTGEYNAPNGVGSALQFDLPEKTQRIDIEIEGQGEGYVLRTPERELVWEDPSEWVSGLKSASWTGVDVVLSDSEQRAKISHLRGFHEDKRIVVESLDARCSGAQKLIESCLNHQGTVRLGKIEYVSALRSDTTAQILRALSNALDLNTRSDTVVKNLILDVANQKFKGEVTVEAGISATVKFEGRVSYSESEGKTAIKLEKAKALFVDVRGKIFDALEDAQSDTLIVERPWIYLLSN